MTGLLQAVIVARVLGAREYGVAALAIAAPSLVFTFFDPQAYEAVVKYVSRFRGEDEPDRVAAVVRLAYVADAGLAVIGFLVVAAGARFAAAHILKEPHTAILLVVAAAGLSAGGPTSTSRALLISLDRYALVGKLATLGTVARTILVFALLGSGLRAEAVVYGSALGIVFESLIMGIAADRALVRVVGRSWRSVSSTRLGPHGREVLSFMFYTELTSLVAVLVKQADIVVLGAVRGSRAAGFYRLAWALVTPVTRVTIPLQQVFYPRAATMAAAGDWPGLRDLIRSSTKRVGVPLAVCVLLALPVLAFGVPTMAGDDYRGAVAPACILLVGAAVAVALFWVRPAYLAAGLMRPLLVLSSTAAGLAIVGFLLAAPVGGAVGVAAVRAIFTGVAGGAAAGIYLVRKLRGALPVPVGGQAIVAETTGGGILP